MANEVSIGGITRQVVTDCIRKWAAGLTLSVNERAVMDEALALNRMDLLHALFSERESSDAAR